MPERARPWAVAAIVLAEACHAHPQSTPVVVQAASPAPAAPAPQPAKPEPAAQSENHPTVHLEGTWIPVRAERLGIDLATAKARDLAFAPGPPEDGLWWDQALAEEVWGVWTDVCKECHQGSRSLTKVLKLPPPPRGWVEKYHRFFSDQRSPRAVFRSVAEGAKALKKDEKDMPAWAAKLTNEQMWGLVYFVAAVSKQKGNDLK